MPVTTSEPSVESAVSILLDKSNGELDAVVNNAGMALAGISETFTPEQLRDRIERGLSDYVSKPVVTVILQEEKSHKFNVLGQVQKPGSYLLNSSMTVLDGIAMAGGLREWAKVNSIYVLRETSPGIRQKMPFHYNDVVKGNGQDVQLQTKDTIVVP